MLIKGLLNQFEAASLRSTLISLALIAFVYMVGGLTACTRAVEQNAMNSAEPSLIPFQGTWTATGNRDTLRLAGDRRASLSKFEGSIVLQGNTRPAVGFRADAILFNDSETGIVGRAVWTDERGQQIFSELSKPVSGSNITGRFIGGTGRYAGVTGEYQFSWRFLIESEDGSVQGQSTGLKGTVRITPAVTQSGNSGANHE